MSRLVLAIFSPRRLPIGLLLAALLLASSTPGCKPAGSPAGEPSQPPPADARHPPGTEDLARFFRGTLPPAFQLVELKSDPPVPLLGTASGDHAWTYNVRLTFAPAEDVLGPPAPHHAAVFREAVDDLAELAVWSQAYARSPYAARYPSLSVAAPAPANLMFLAVLQAKDQPYPPVYGQMSAAWQVDHWHYAVTSLQAPTTDDGDGKLRSQYKDPLLIQNSPEAARFLAQAQAARTQHAAIEATYQEDLRRATQPGTLYRGQLRYQGKAAAAEVRFAAPPAGSDPATEVLLELRLPEAPDLAFTYLARRAKRLPLRLDAPTADASTDAEEATPTPTPRKAEPLPKGDLTLRFVAATGQSQTGAPRGTVPGEFLHVTRLFVQPGLVTLSVHDGRLEGQLNGYPTNHTDFVLSVQQSP